MKNTAANLGTHSERKWKHRSTSTTYHRWTAMKNRVKHVESYQHLSIQEDWKDDFDKFVEDMGQCREEDSLDRKDNDRGYSKENCRWVKKALQNKNRRCNIMVGEMPLKEFAESVGVPYGTMYYRVKNMGLTPQQASTYKQGKN